MTQEETETVDADEQEPVEEPTTETPPETDEVEKWKAMSRKNEKALKDALGRIEQLEQLNGQEHDEAVKAAVESTRAELRAEFAEARVGDLVRLAAQGRGTDPEKLVEALDPKKFLTDEGDPDESAITTWVDKVTPRRFPDVGSNPTPPPAESQFLTDMKAALGAT